LAALVQQEQIIMELFGGVMVLLWMLGFFLTVIWFILPFVIFSIKARVEETMQKIELLDARLVSIEAKLASSSFSQVKADAEQ
jgi:hypothetical protein